MDANEHEYPLKQGVFAVVGCAMDVLNGLGHGLLEKPYERALAIEMAQRAVPFVLQPKFDVVYKGVVVGTYVPDVIAFDSLIVEIKCIDKITLLEVGQVLNYLRITQKSLGLILNFRRSKLEWRRVIPVE